MFHISSQNISNFQTPYFNPTPAQLQPKIDNPFGLVYIQFLTTDEKKDPFVYQGKHSGAWLLPSWIKQFSNNEIIRIWNQAASLLKDASEIIVIGYSLPKEDTAVVALFGSIEYKCKKLTIIDPNPEDIAQKFYMITKIDNIETISSTLEDYL